MVDPLEVVAGTADPAFGTDDSGRIVIWNKAAEHLLGYTADEALGRACCEILCGRSVFGNRFCDEHCVIETMAVQREAVHRFPIDLCDANGRFVRFEMSIVVIPGPKRSQFTIIHLLQPRSATQQMVPTSSTLDDPSSAIVPEIQPLTTRETEVLLLVADGRSSQQIADDLFISVATVRNHVQNVLHKLDAHSKSEAVSIALRNRVI